VSLVGKLLAGLESVHVQSRSGVHDATSSHRGGNLAGGRRNLGGGEGVRERHQKERQRLEKFEKRKKKEEKKKEEFSPKIIERVTLNPRAAQAKSKHNNNIIYKRIYGWATAENFYFRILFSANGRTSIIKRNTCLLHTRNIVLLEHFFWKSDPDLWLYGFPPKLIAQECIPGTFLKS
jgi:hypothetical protein